MTPPTDNLAEVPPPSGDVTSDITGERLTHCADRLQGVAERTMEFLQAQLNHLDDAFTALPIDASSTKADAEENWQAEKALWERQKAVDEARIEEQLDHLTSAWKELEAEQRRLMTLGRVTSETAKPSAGSSVAPATQGSLDLVEPRRRDSSASAAIQFQKLKREILQQSRRPH